MKCCSGKWLHTRSRGGFLLAPGGSWSLPAAEAAAPAGSPAAQRGSSAAPALSTTGRRHVHRLQIDSALQQPKLHCSWVLLHVFLWVPALQGSSPLYRGQPGWNAVMHAKRGIFLIKVLLCVQVDSMSKAKHKSSSGLTGVSILPEGEPISQAYPRSCSNGKEQTNTEPNEAFMNRLAGATQERNHSSVSVSGMFAISSVTWQLRTDASTFATGLTNYN